MNEFLSTVRESAQEQIDHLDVQKNDLLAEVRLIEEEQKKLRKVIKAASDEPLIPERKENDKPKKPLGITDKTRTNVTQAIKTVTQDGALDFSIPAIAENMHANGNNPSSVGNAIKVLREEGHVRLVGKEGVTPIYRWVNNA